MENKIYSLNTLHASVIRDALENQIKCIEDNLKKYKHVFKEEEIIRLENCIKIRHEALDPILRILNGDEGWTGINFYMKKDITKEIDEIFFSDFYDLLEKHIDPKSEEMSWEIYTAVKDICRLNSYWWKTTKNKCVGTYTVEDNASNPLVQ